MPRRSGDDLGDQTRAVERLRPRLVQTIQAGASNAVANLSFGFNAIGSLTSRGDATQSVTEAFTYDSMNRLSVSVRSDTPCSG